MRPVSPFRNALRAQFRVVESHPVLLLELHDWWSPVCRKESDWLPVGT